MHIPGHASTFRSTFFHLKIWQKSPTLPACRNPADAAEPAPCPCHVSSFRCRSEAPGKNRLPQLWHYTDCCTDLRLSLAACNCRQTHFCSPLNCWPCPANCSHTPTKLPEKKISVVSMHLRSNPPFPPIRIGGKCPTNSWYSTSGFLGGELRIAVLQQNYIKLG